MQNVDYERQIVDYEESYVKKYDIRIVMRHESVRILVSSEDVLRDSRLLIRLEKYSEFFKTVFMLWLEPS